MEIPKYIGLISELSFLVKEKSMITMVKKMKML